jgi:prepilin-type N-terminal cleavage/methylation domain-containing protein
MNNFPTIRKSPGSRPQSHFLNSGFTLIELLVVIAIIGLLAGLILGGAGIATVKGRIARVQSEQQALVTAIEQYKSHKGYYPPDNPNSTFLNSLFYELTGAVQTNVAGVPGFAAVTGEKLDTNNVTTLFGVGGILNSSADKNEPAENFFGSAGKTARTGAFYISGTSGPTYTLFGVPVPPGAPSVLKPAPGNNGVNPWNYVSSNPTNNPNHEFDLWLDVVWRGKTNRLGNWSKDPIPLP